MVNTWFSSFSVTLASAGVTKRLRLICAVPAYIEFYRCFAAMYSLRQE